MSKINVVEKLGEGAYGKVYKCSVEGMEDFGLKSGTEYAIKVLSCTQIGFSPNEIDIISQSKHPYILPMIAIISNNDNPEFFEQYGFKDELHQNGIIMPLAEMSFMEYIASSKWNLEDVKKYFGQIASALQYLHYKNYVHLDIKLENVVINDNNDAMLIDFGQAQYVPVGQRVKLNTHITTTCYRPPELLTRPENSECIYNSEVDVWALGILFLEILQRKTCSLTDTNKPRTILNSLKRCLSLTKRREYLTECLEKTVSKEEDIKYFVELLYNMLELNPQRRWNMIEVCKYLNTTFEEKPLITIEPLDFSSATLNTEAIPFIKQILNEEMYRISVATIFLAFDTFYRVLMVLDEKRLGMQCNIFIGCLNIAILMNEKAYIDLNNYSENVKDVYGMMWDVIVKGLQCNVRTHRYFLMSEEEIQTELSNIYNTEEYGKTVGKGEQFVYDEMIVKYLPYVPQ